MQAMSQSKSFDELMRLFVLRRSVRKYDTTIVPTEDEVRQMVSGAHLAPSAGNSRNRRFIAIFSQSIKLAMKDAVKKKISEILDKINSVRARNEFSRYANAYYTFFSSAPLVFAVVMKPYDSLSRRIIRMYNIDDIPSTSSAIQGVAAAIENLLLAATSLGYGSCWMTGPLVARFELEKILDIKSPEELVAIVPVGKPLTMNKEKLELNRIKPSDINFPEELLKIIR